MEITINYINQLHKKDKSTKFEYETSSQKIPFLDAMVYKEK